jgi:hypothetical protein
MRDSEGCWVRRKAVRSNRVKHSPSPLLKRRKSGIRGCKPEYYILFIVIGGPMLLADKALALTRR